VYSRNNRFECRWQPSKALFIGYCAAQLLAQCSAFTLALPFPAVFALSLVCLAHGAWVLPRHVLLSSAHSITGLQRSPQGWAVFSHAKGWQPVQ
jgi:toxin CptA